MSVPDKSHPDYADGYWDRMEGCALAADASAEYMQGWEAAGRAKAIMAANGMTETSPGEFSITLPVSRPSGDA